VARRSATYVPPDHLLPSLWYPWPDHFLNEAVNSVAAFIGTKMVRYAQPTRTQRCGQPLVNDARHGTNQTFPEKNTLIQIWNLGI
jgi:hypothetical protein